MCLQVQGNSDQEMSKIHADLAKYTYQDEKCSQSIGKLFFFVNIHIFFLNLL
jgi:hypothetical protein